MYETIEFIGGEAMSIPKRDIPKRENQVGLFAGKK